MTEQMKVRAAEGVRYLTTRELADRLRSNEGTIRYWRHVGYGPVGVKMGRRVVYPLAEVERFERETAAQAGAAVATA